MLNKIILDEDTALIQRVSIMSVLVGHDLVGTLPLRDLDSEVLSEDS